MSGSTQNVGRKDKFTQTTKRIRRLCEKCGKQFTKRRKFDAHVAKGKCGAGSRGGLFFNLDETKPEAKSPANQGNASLAKIKKRKKSSISRTRVTKFDSDSSQDWRNRPMLTRAQKKHMLAVEMGDKSVPSSSHVEETHLKTNSVVENNPHKVKKSDEDKRMLKMNKQITKLLKSIAKMKKKMAKPRWQWKVVRLEITPPEATSPTNEISLSYSNLEGVGNLEKGENEDISGI